MFILKVIFGLGLMAFASAGVAQAQDLETRVAGLEARVKLLESNSGSASSYYKLCEGSCPGGNRFTVVLKSIADGHVIDRINRSFNYYDDCVAEYQANCFKY